MHPLELPDANDIQKIINRIESGAAPTHKEALSLVRLVYSIMTPDHTWWRPVPLPVGQILIAANDTTITPPMVFNDEDEAEFFAKANQTLMYLLIPKPPCLKEEKP